MKTALRIFILIIVAVFSQIVFAGPRLIFNDSGFDYTSHEVAYLHFSRAVASDLVMVYVNDQAQPKGLPLYLGGLPAGLTREDIYERLGMSVSEQALELTFHRNDTSSLEVLDYFHTLAPELGFSKELAMFAGDTYVVAYGCQLHEDTHLRVSFKHSGDLILVRFTLQTPFAY